MCFYIKYMIYITICSHICEYQSKYFFSHLNLPSFSKLLSPVLYQRHIYYLFLIKVNIFTNKNSLLYFKIVFIYNINSEKILYKKYLDNLDFFLKNGCKNHLKNHNILSRATYYLFSLYLIQKVSLIFWEDFKLHFSYN